MELIPEQIPPEQLPRTVSARVLGMQMILASRFHTDGEGMIRTVHPEEIAGTGLSRRDLFRTALENMTGRMPPQIYLPEEWAPSRPRRGSGLLPEEQTRSRLLLRRPQALRAKGYVLTNSFGKCGAAVILYPDLPRQLCHLLRSNLYVAVPDPEHVLVFRTEDISPAGLRIFLGSTGGPAPRIWIYRCFGELISYRPLA